MSKQEDFTEIYNTLVKVKVLSPFPFPGKTRLLFAMFGLLLPGNRVRLQVKGLESKFDKIL